MSSRSIGILLAAMIIALTMGLNIIFFSSLQNRALPAFSAVKPSYRALPQPAFR